MPPHEVIMRDVERVALEIYMTPIGILEDWAKNGPGILSGAASLALTWTEKAYQAYLDERPV